MIASLIPVGFLVAASLITLSSISTPLFLLQLLWATIGFGIIFLLLLFDWRSFLNYRWLITGFYLLVIALLVLVYFAGPVIRNVRGWLVLGPFQFQPVELMKIALILVYAEYFSRRHLSVARWRNIFTSFLYFIVPALLVAVQPDLGSVAVLFGIWFGFLLVSGLPPRRVIAALIFFVIAGVLLWTSVLENYQRERILGVFYPERNSLSVNYSVIQSKIAIGSAGLFGKGYNQGSQTQLGFLTEPATDFIFAAFVEEWGWLAGILLIGAFLTLIYRILKVGFVADQNFEKFICLGSAMVLGLQFFLKIGRASCRERV